MGKNARIRFDCDRILNTPITLVPFETGHRDGAPPIADARTYVPTFRV